MRRWISTVLVSLLAAGCASNQGFDAAFDAMLSGQAPRPVLPPQEAAEVARSPLGSARNPVRAEGPPGQRAYLLSLRCPEGGSPGFERAGSAGVGPYGAVMDVYLATCDATQTPVYMDMYHPGYIERQAVAGFIMATPDELP